MSTREDETDAGGGFTVNDRRWWAKPGGAAAGAAAEADDAHEADDAETEPDPGPAQAPADDGSAKIIAYLQEQLHDRDRKLEAALDRQRSALAELDKTRARLERDAARQLELSRRDLVRDLLDLLDDLERAIDAAGEASEGSALLDGVSLVARRFHAKLAELGVTAEDPNGKRFDPNLHDAVSLVPVPNAALDGVVVGVIKKGYRIGEETLRPALVAVGKATASGS